MYGPKCNVVYFKYCVPKVGLSAPWSYPSQWSKPGSSCPKSRTGGWIGCRPWWQNTASWSECFDPTGLRSDGDDCPHYWLERRGVKRKGTFKKLQVGSVQMYTEIINLWSNKQFTYIGYFQRAHTPLHLTLNFSAHCTEDLWENT